MRSPLIIANWKMYKTVWEAVEAAREIQAKLPDISAVEVVLCPPFTALAAVKEAVARSNIKLGAQNMYWEDQGAFTGEISPVMLAELCDYVMLGHAERRQFFGETNEKVNKKVKAALAHGLTPIACVFLDLAHKESGETFTFVGGHVKTVLADLPAEDARKVIIALEPVWAVGTGQSADPIEANSVINLGIRGAIADMYGKKVAQQVPVLYGGSVKPDNIEAFLRQPDIDGIVAGASSLQIDNFVALVQKALATFKD